MARSRVGLLLLFLVALALRLMFTMTWSGDPYAFYDSHDYDSIARNLIAGDGFREDVGRQASRAPGYPLFLAACYSLGLENPRAIFAIQSVADAAMCVALVVLGRRLCGERAGRIAGWIAAVYPFFIYFSGLLLAETLFTALFVSFMLILVIAAKAQDNPGRLIWVAACAGTMAGALTHLRSSFLLFPFFLLPFWLWLARPTPRALAAWAAMIASMSFVLLPWIIRNHRIFGHFIPTTLQVGESLYEANSPEADGGPAMDRIDWVRLRGGGMMTEYEHNEFFKREALRYISQHPARFARLALEKFRRFWNPVPNYEAYRRPWHAALSIAAFVPVVVLGLFGAIRMRDKPALVLLTLSPVIYYTALHMVFVGSIRYRVPIMPFVILLAAAGADWAWPARDATRPDAHAQTNGEASHGA